MTEKSRVDFPLLDKTNYLIWIDHVRDYLLEKDFYDAYEASELTGEEEADEDDEDSFNYADREPAMNTVKARAAWAYIRKHLSEDMYRKSQQVEFGNCASLLRMLRLNWHADSPYDRNTLSEQYFSMKLGDYSDFEAYKDAFEHQVSLLEKYKVAAVGEDEDKLFRFQKGLPKAYDEHTNIVLARGLTFTQALSYYSTIAKRYPELPGSTSIAAKTTEKTFNTSEEICRAFAKGKCYRKHCRFKHILPPGGTNTTNQQQERSSRKFTGNCNYCQKLGHKAKDCFKRKADEKKKGQERSQPVQERAHAAGEEHKAEKGDSTAAKPSVSHSAIEGAWVTQDEMDPTTLTLAAEYKRLHPDDPDNLTLLLDGGSTVFIIQDESKCHDVKDADTYVTVGGGRVRCRKIGMFSYEQTINGKSVRKTAPAKIVPNFGVDILPEGLYLSEGA